METVHSREMIRKNVLRCAEQMGFNCTQKPAMIAKDEMNTVGIASTCTFSFNFQQLCAKLSHDSLRLVQTD